MRRHFLPLALNFLKRKGNNFIPTFIQARQFSNDFAFKQQSIFQRNYCISKEKSYDFSKVNNGIPGTQAPGEKFVIMFTCTVCNTRSAKTISKNAYENGVVLCRCPGCENLHLIADRLGWFEDESFDIEKLMKTKGEKVKVVRDDNILELTEKDIIGDYKQN